jgi:hypothetical protein
MNNLINYGELSRLLSGSRHTIRKNKIPKIHQDKINELEKFCQKWVESIKK